jgi:hypothetical protein
MQPVPPRIKTPLHTWTITGFPKCFNRIQFSGWLADLEHRENCCISRHEMIYSMPWTKLDLDGFCGIFSRPSGCSRRAYLERDLRQSSAISSLPDFQRVMVLAVQRTGKLLNQAGLARDAALSHPTTHDESAR